MLLARKSLVSDIPAAGKGKSLTFLTFWSPHSNVYQCQELTRIENPKNFNGSYLLTVVTAEVRANRLEARWLHPLPRVEQRVAMAAAAVCHRRRVTLVRNAVEALIVTAAWRLR